jgi:CPA1 family monovalent cation:H+ antiporter
MDHYTFAALLLAFAVGLSYLNQRFIRLQATIAVMLASLLVSMGWIILDALGLWPVNLAPVSLAKAIAQETHFQDLLLKGLLGYLLFAGSLSVDLPTLLAKRTEIAVLAFLSTIASAFLIGGVLYYLLMFLGIPLPLLYCFLFGALISPTDPIAVLSLFKQVRIAKSLETIIAGESLFNDGVGIVLFTSLFALTFDHITISFTHVARIFLEQALGGLAFGTALGFITQVLIKPLIKEPKMLILTTIAMVSAGYSIALNLNISGPLAMVVMGIWVGHYLRTQTHRTPCHSVEQLESFWEVIDDLLNLLLFLLIGFEMVIIDLNSRLWGAMLLAIPLVLMARLMTVALPMSLIARKKPQEPFTIAILTWGGLRGGLALALSLSLPNSPAANIIVAMTYSVVAFSVIIQGISMGKLANAARLR